jgi:hypothetical protein
MLVICSKKIRRGQFLMWKYNPLARPGIVGLSAERQAEPCSSAKGSLRVIALQRGEEATRWAEAGRRNASRKRGAEKGGPGLQPFRLLERVSPFRGRLHPRKRMQVKGGGPGCSRNRGLALADLPARLKGATGIVLFFFQRFSPMETFPASRKSGAALAVEPSGRLDSLDSSRSNHVLGTLILWQLNVARERERERDEY